MIRSLIAASLALSTAVAPVQAAQPFNEYDLLHYFSQIGGRVYEDSELCNKYDKAYGIQTGNQVHICTARHEGDEAELKDTIRHELWHIAQMCNEGPLGNDPIKTIVTAHKRGWTGEGYKPEVWHIEAEAFAAAALLDASDIKQAIDKYCF